MGIGEETEGGRGPAAELRRVGSGPRIFVLGPLRIERDGQDVALPPSRKVRALLGYLAIAPRPVPRAKLCDLLWDVANDPRSELRWCLTKIRPLIDEPAKPRLIADRDWVGLDGSALAVDAQEYQRLFEPVLRSGSIADLRSLVTMVGGDLLEGLYVERSPLFETWLAGERHKFVAWHLQVLQRLTQLLPPNAEELLELLSKRLALTPHDMQAHLELLAALRARGLKAEAENHMAQACRLLENEGLDAAPLRLASSRLQAGTLLEPRPVGAEMRSVAADPATPGGATLGNERQADHLPAPRRASIAVMPFVVAAPADQGLADGVAHDIIIGLAKMRSLMVIARGTTFALRDRSLNLREAGALLGVTYVASGVIQREKERLRISIELIECATGQIVWAEDFTSAPAQVLAMLGTLATRIVTSIDAEIHAAERSRAIVKPPNSLDAWEAYHCGLWHMYRFRAEDNDKAQTYLQHAISRDPAFSRALAALSFTHFQNAFLLKGAEDRQRETNSAFDAAGRSLMADALDPAAHWAMGRALWLRGEDGSAVRSLDEAVRLSPNFAMGHYTLAFLHSQTGDPAKAVAAVDTSQQLSPYDPLLFAMYAARAFALMRLNRTEEAAEWARKAVQQPNAHVHVHAACALNLAAAGKIDEAKGLLTHIRQERPDYDISHFFSAFRMHSDLEEVYCAARA